MNETDLKTWKLFGQRYSEFKQQKHAQIKNLNQQNSKSFENPTIASINTITSNGNIKAKIEEKDGFNEWDYVNTTEKIYLLTDQSLNSEKIVYLNKKDKSTLIIKSSDKNRQVNLFRQESDDLDLSETENTLSLSDDDCFTSKVPNHSSINKLIIEQKVTKPSLKDLYFNMYDNLSKDKLFYIVDNQYTIVPDSYIVYINKKREIYFQQLKLANSVYFQKKWLNLSLDLEFKIN